MSQQLLNLQTLVKDLLKQFSNVTLDEARLNIVIAPIDMVLFCPACGKQHIDEPDDEAECLAAMAEGRESWLNPPHRSHQCERCGHVWRPADVPTNGVAAVTTKGVNDSPLIAGYVKKVADTLADEIIDKMLSEPIPGGSQARDWFLPHETKKGLENVREVVRRMFARWRA